MKFCVALFLLFLAVLFIPRAPVASAQTPSVVCAQTYTVVAGDWLSNTASKLLGNADTYRAIFIATNLKAQTDPTFTTLTNPNVIKVGSKLCIPSLTDAVKLLASDLFPAQNSSAPTPSSTPPVSATPAVTPNGSTTASLRPEDITFVPYGLGTKVQGVLVPSSSFDNSEPPGPVGAPAHIAFQFDGVERLWVIPAQAYQAQWDAAGNSTVSQSLSQLRVLLDNQPVAPPPPLPMLPPDNATNDLAARVRYLAFDGGSGFSFIGRSAHDPSPILASQLYYSFFGLTNDGKYIVSFRYPIETSFLPKTTSDLTPAHLAEIQADPRAYFQETTDLLNQRKNSDFGPDLSRLDALVFSIHVPSTGTAQPRPTASAATPSSLATGGQTPVAPTNPAVAYRQLLIANEWKWVQTTTSTQTITVDDPSKYSVRFNGANGFGVTSDCNIGAGNFVVVGNVLDIKDLQSTKIFCGETSLDTTFTTELLSADTFSFQGSTLLIVLKDNGGTMKFSK